MRGIRLCLIGGSWAALAVAAAVVAPTPAARAQEVTQVVPSMPTGCWKLVVAPDTSSKVGGRLEFEELVYFEGYTFTGQEIARLGFTPGTITGGTNAAGQTTFSVTLTSGTQGTITASGIYLTTSMSGTFSWVRDGKTYLYNFTGAPFTPAVDPES
jgi:hypothetical protein